MSVKSSYREYSIDKETWRSGSDPFEVWARRKLFLTRMLWKGRCQWGYHRLELMCPQVGLAVSIDEPNDDEETLAEKDVYDEHNFRRSGLIILRVKRGDGPAIKKVIELAAKLDSWENRRNCFDLSKCKGKILTRYPARIHMLEEYLELLKSHQLESDILTDRQKQPHWLKYL